jgi:hypothetical protein
VRAQLGVGRYRVGDNMSSEIKLQIISRRRVFWLAVAALAAPAVTLVLSEARAQSDQAPADPAAPQKKTKKKADAKTKKTKPATATDPATTPAAAPK